MTQWTGAQAWFWVLSPALHGPLSTAGSSFFQPPPICAVWKAKRRRNKALRCVRGWRRSKEITQRAANACVRLRFRSLAPLGFPAPWLRTLLALKIIAWPGRAMNLLATAGSGKNSPEHCLRGQRKERKSQVRGLKGGHWEGARQNEISRFLSHC